MFSLCEIRKDLPEGWWSSLGESTADLVSEKEELALPPRALSMQATSNSLNPRTQISFYLPTNGRVKIEIFDVRGRKVKTLLNEDVTAGEHSKVWLGDDTRSKKVSSGVYFIKMHTDHGNQQQRVTLIR